MKKYIYLLILIVVPLISRSQTITYKFVKIISVSSPEQIYETPCKISFVGKDVTIDFLDQTIRVKNAEITKFVPKSGDADSTADVYTGSTGVVYKHPKEVVAFTILGTLYFSNEKPEEKWSVELDEWFHFL